MDKNVMLIHIAIWKRSDCGEWKNAGRHLFQKKDTIAMHTNRVSRVAVHAEITNERIQRKTKLSQCLYAFLLLPLNDL
jgi:hypothetical protein